MKHTISVLVENHAGVLSRISGLFSRRGFNIDSLAVGVTEDPTISRITIVVDGNDHTVEQVEKQLNKLIDVLKVRTIPSDELLKRELVLIKIEATPNERREIMDIVQILGARIIDLTVTTLTIEVTEKTENIERLLALLSEYSVKEIARTGVIALQKGSDTIKGNGKQIL
ncbi:acetolactate synthase small subunit [Candidatus Soleaferrea massiliensis]|uniref:acetolactate synthase small subunit n=1 Tax=Candidatus Soleaferrea massiliensis TaxID=1470354 RepID=UPI00058ACF51|nr:acetolactate synthase small subunit [Candidatus Soleaferrea massiliensis]